MWSCSLHCDMTGDGWTVAGMGMSAQWRCGWKSPEQQHVCYLLIFLAETHHNSLQYRNIYSPLSRSALSPLFHSVILKKQEGDKDYANVEQIRFVLGKFSSVSWTYREDSLWFWHAVAVCQRRKRKNPARQCLYTAVTLCLTCLFPLPPRSVLIGWNLAGRINSHLLLSHLISQPCKN